MRTEKENRAGRGDIRQDLLLLVGETSPFKDAVAHTLALKGAGIIDRTAVPDAGTITASLQNVTRRSRLAVVALDADDALIAAWVTAAEDAGCATSCLFAVGYPPGPASVASISAAEGKGSWAHRTLLADKATRGLPRTVMLADLVCTNWQAEFARVADALDIVLAKSSRETVSSIDALMGDIGALDPGEVIKSDKVQSIVETLMAWARGTETRGQRARLTRLLNTIEGTPDENVPPKKDRKGRSRASRQGVKADQTEMLRQEISRLKKKLADRDAAIREADLRATRMETEKVQLADSLGKATRDLRVQEARTSELQREQDRLKAVIHQHDSSLRQREEEIEQKDRQVAAAEKARSQEAEASDEVRESLAAAMASISDLEAAKARHLKVHFEETAMLSNMIVRRDTRLTELNIEKQGLEEKLAQALSDAKGAQQQIAQLTAKQTEMAAYEQSLSETAQSLEADLQKTRQSLQETGKTEDAVRYALEALIQSCERPYLPQKTIRSRQAKLLRKSGLFDADWYLKTYPDVAETGLDPTEHYIEFGHVENRMPSAVFKALRNAKMQNSSIKSDIH